MRPARLIDLGLTAPRRLHAAYSGLAHAQQEDAAPIVLWGRARAHVSVGQGQSAALLARGLDVPVARRPLGGGCVWVDPQQIVVAFVVPLVQAPRRHTDWFDWLLAPVVATYRAFGVPAERRDRDIWVRGRKIGGSGAATLGAAAVLATSFLLRFPAERFARCLASRGPGYRAWLREGLELTMTDWAREGRVPSLADLQAAFRRSVASELGWSLRKTMPNTTERQAMREALTELDLPWHEPRPPTGGSILKLNADAFLADAEEQGRRVRRLVVGGVTVKEKRYG